MHLFRQFGRAHMTYLSAAVGEWKTRAGEVIIYLFIFNDCDCCVRQSPGPFGLAVDVGCGSGQGTVLLAPYFTQVLGLDVSPAQLEMALVNCCPPNVTYK